MKNKRLNKNLIDLIVKYQLPQFVWIVEISNETLFDKKQADGIVIIDATEKDIKNFNPIILAAANGKLIVQNPKVESHSYLDFQEESLSLSPFWMFNDNLKLYKQ